MPRSSAVWTVICGHIHSASDRRIGKVRYLNCGDWVDTCSAVVEHYDGRIEVLHWGMEAAAPLPVGEAEARPLPVVSAGKARSPLDVERIYLTPDV